MLIQTRGHFTHKVLYSIYSVVIPIHLNREMASVYSSFSYSSLTTNLKYTVLCMRMNSTFSLESGR